MKNHNSASLLRADRACAAGRRHHGCGIRSELFPAYGSVVDRLAPVQRRDADVRSRIPYVIRDGSVTPGQARQLLGKMHDPLLFTARPEQARTSRCRN